METIKTWIGAFFIIAGIVMMAGSGGDCDGHCGPGNTISEMIMLSFIGLCLFGTGVWFAISAEKQGLTNGKTGVIIYYKLTKRGTYET